MCIYFAWLDVIHRGLSSVMVAILLCLAPMGLANGAVEYICEDGMCRLVDAPVPVKKVVPLTGIRVAQGLMSAEEFVAFLEGEAPTSPFAGKSAVLLALVILVGGILLNATPCVFPMIPVNLLIIGRSFSRGLIFAAGIVLGYGALGIGAAFFGAAISAFASSAWFNLVCAIAFALLALAQFGVFELRLLRRRATLPGALRAFGVFLLGLMSAALAGACVAPILIAVLMLTAERAASGSYLAVFYPFLLGVGLALPWPIAAAGLDRILPKPGAWMKGVNRMLGVFVILVAAWYAVQAWKGFHPITDTTLESFDRAKLPQDKPVLVDCWASWCKNCRAMDSLLQNDPSVRKALSRFKVVRLQAEDLRALQAKPGFETVQGLPAFVIFP